MCGVVCVIFLYMTPVIMLLLGFVFVLYVDAQRGVYVVEYTFEYFCVFMNILQA